MMPRAIFIDAHAMTITEVEIARGEVGLPDLRELLGGYIDLAYHWPDGDTLYVDDAGYLKAPKVGFRIAVRDDALAGNGVIVGREIEGEQYPGGYTTTDPRITIAGLRRLIRFVRFVEG